MLREKSHVGAGNFDTFFLHFVPDLGDSSSCLVIIYNFLLCIYLGVSLFFGNNWFSITVV